MQRERDLWIGISFLKKKTGILSNFSNIFMILFLIAASSLRSFSIDDGDGTFKMNSRFSFQTFSNLLQFAEKVKCRLISPGIDFLETALKFRQFRRERNIRRRLFTSSIKVIIIIIIIFNTYIALFL